MQSDYRERRFVSKNKPRRQLSIGVYAATIVAIVLTVFVSGFAGGWFACWYRMKKTASLNLSAVAAPATSPSTGQQSQLPLPPKTQQTPLTFYETLPKGGKGVIGSGINANLQEHQPAPPVAVTPQPQPVQPPVKPAPSVPPVVAKPPAPTPEKPVPAQSEGERKFTVQVASVKDKAEAESLRNKLAAKGLNPIIFEVKLPEKGVVYRVRAGRHMLQREAQELAAKLGSGAIVTPE